MGGPDPLPPAAGRFAHKLPPPTGSVRVRIDDGTSLGIALGTK